MCFKHSRKYSKRCLKYKPELVNHCEVYGIISGIIKLVNAVAY